MNRIFAQRKTNISNIGFYAKVTIASNIDNFFQFYFICLKPSQYALSFICLFSFFLVILFRVRIFTLSLSYGSKFSSTCNLGSLLGLSQVPVFSQVPLLVLDYRWSVAQSTYLLKDCYLQLVLNPHCSQTLLQKQLEYRLMLLTRLLLA